MSIFSNFLPDIFVSGNPRISGWVRVLKAKDTGKGRFAPASPELPWVFYSTFLKIQKLPKEKSNIDYPLWVSAPPTVGCWLPTCHGALEVLRKPLAIGLCIEMSDIIPQLSRCEILSPERPNLHKTARSEHSKLQPR